MKEQIIDFLTSEKESELINGIVVGKLFTINAASCPFVDFQQNVSSFPLEARTIVAVNKHDIGCDVTIMFENGDPQKPIITGIIQSGNTEEVILSKESTIAQVDNERIVFDAKKEIVLRCGNSSITLTKAGKILIRGKYLLSRSSGVNRIKGGSVQIN